jgi:hypothetical protein
LVLAHCERRLLRDGWRLPRLEALVASVDVVVVVLPVEVAHVGRDGRNQNCEDDRFLCTRKKFLEREVVATLAAPLTIIAFFLSMLRCSRLVLD